MGNNNIGDVSHHSSSLRGTTTRLMVTALASSRAMHSAAAFASSSNFDHFLRSTYWHPAGYLFPVRSFGKKTAVIFMGSEVRISVTEYVTLPGASRRVVFFSPLINT